MGTYIPARPKKKRSVSDTLLEAEQEHYLDCPNADLLSRAAALLLDLILCTLASSAIHHLCGAVSTSILSAPFFSDDTQPSLFWMSHVQKASQYVNWVLKITVFYFYLIWSVQQFGGTPAKLLLGLRVLDEQSGERLSYSAVFWREALLKPALSLFSGLFAVARKDRRALHDLLSSSVVKKVRGPQ